MLVFAAVARHGGVRRGALALDVPRSTVSRQLASLERALGGQLVSRSTRRFVLTELGRQLIEHCDRLEALLKAAKQGLERMAREPSGRLTVVASPLVGEELLPPILTEYLQRYPRVQVDLRLSVDFVDVRSVDVALRTAHIVDADDVYSTKIATSFKALYASPEYLKRRGTPTLPEDLSAHACIVVGAGAGAGTWALRAGSSVRSVSVSGSFRVNSYRAAREAALADLGIVRIPAFFGEPLRSAGKLVPVLQGLWPTTTLYAVHAAGRPPPPKIQGFISMVRDGLKTLKYSGE